MSALRGQWIVCVRDVAGGDDHYLGPFHTQEKAQGVADKLRRDIAAVGCSFDSLDAIVEWVQPGQEVEDYRDGMLMDLESLGYSTRAALAATEEQA